MHPPGWYEGESSHSLRYWDGTGWTDQFRPRYPQISAGPDRGERASPRPVSTGAIFLLSAAVLLTLNDIIALPLTLSPLRNSAVALL